MVKKTKEVLSVKPPSKTIDLLDLSEAKFDLTKQWPFAAGSVKEITCNHRLEYIPARLRIPFMEEAYRVLEVGGKLSVIVCYWSSPRAIQDPSIEWPPFVEQSFLYFNKGWREQNKLPAINADFDFSYGYNMEPEATGRNTETQAFWTKHYLNTVTDLHMFLTKRPSS